MMCCGERRETRFCAECGQELINNRTDAALRSLLRHLRSQQTSQEGKMTALSRHPPRDPRLRQRRVEKLQRAVDKWKSWADAVAACLEGPPATGADAAPAPPNQTGVMGEER
jgi:hypothetical protein